MKNIHYIALLASGLILSSSVYAQVAKPAQGLDEIFAPSKTQEILSTQEAQDNAKERIAQLYEGDKVIINTISASYSFANGTATISSKKIENGIANNISAKISEGADLKTADILKSLANSIDRGTAFCEEIVLSRLVLVALSQSIEALDKKGLISTYAEGDLNVITSITADSAKEGSLNVEAKITTAKGDISAKLVMVKSEDGSYQIAGDVAESPLALKITPNADTDTYTFAGESDGNEVKSTVSNKIDLSLTLNSSSLKIENGNGTLIKLRLAQNDKNNTHNVTETLQNGDTFSTSYKGNTLIPYEEFKVLATDFNN